jgi:glycosyltransferase involved in cell wall biosynthesis
MTSVSVHTPVSIGLPVYNGSRFIAQSIESILAQTYAHFELIICDNCSTDDTENICRSFAAHDPRIRYVRNPKNLGASGNYNRTVELATGTYVRWATHDDLTSADALEKCVKILETRPDVVLVYPRSVLIDGQGNVTGDYPDGLHAMSGDPIQRAKQVINNLGYCNPVYGLMRTSVLRRTPLLENYVASDNPLLVELSFHGKFYELRDAYFYRRIHDEAWSSITDVQKMVSWYRPGQKRNVVMVESRQIWQYILSARRAPLGLKGRVRFVGAVIHHAASRRNRLAGEVKRALHQLLARHSSSQ